MTIEHGCTRYVILTKKYAIKIPQFKYEWKHFLLGLLANMQEVRFSTVNNDDRICPVKFHIAGGWLLIMPRCKPITRKEFFNLDTDRFWPEDKNSWWIPVERKEDSFGWYNNKIVAVDYGS